MNRSLVLFLSGTVLGAAGTALTISMFEPSGASTQMNNGAVVAEIKRDLADIKAQLAGIASNIGEASYTASIPALVAAPHQNPSQTPAMQNSATAAAPSPADATPAAAQLHTIAPVVSSAPTTPIPPTPQQVEQYESIKSRLAEAANNHTISLAELVRLGDQLTTEQKMELSAQAIDMINRGELNMNQFAQPASN